MITSDDTPKTGPSWKEPRRYCISYSPQDERDGVPSYTYDCQRTDEHTETP